MNIEEIRRLVEQHQREVEHLNDERRQLEENRNTMSEEEYNRELENINTHLTREQESLQQNEELNRNYSSMVENLRRLNSLNEISPRDEAERAGIEAERNARLEEVQRAAFALPEELRREAREEILNARQTTTEETVKEITTGEVENTSNKTRKQELDEEIARRQEEIIHLDNMMSQLEAARGVLSEEEYNRERENITRYIERENNRLSDSRRIASAYDNMISNIRKLNELDNITPRDSQDENQILEEREQREEEIKRAREILPEEYQAEIRNIIQKESASKEQDNQVSSQQQQTQNQQQQTQDQQQNQKSATERMLDPEFQPHLMPWDEYKKLFRQAQRENQDNQENQIALNNIHNKYKSDRKLFQKDENGNVICYDNTTIPRPREREIGEDPKEYEKFLNEKYGPIIEDYYKKQEKKDNEQKRIEEKKPVGLIEEKEKDDKQLPIPKPKPDPDPKPNPEPKPKPQEEERKTLQQIMYELQKGLEIRAKSGKRYQAANIKVAKNFKNELKSGNVWYNVVHFAPTIIKSAVAGIKKVAAKFNLWRTEQTHTMDVLKDRIDNLSDADLQVIWEEYRGTQVNQDSFTSALNTMLNERIQRFAHDRVAQINNQIAAGYSQIFGDYQVIQGINEALGQAGISDADKARLQAQKQALLAGKAEQIGNIRKLYIQGNNYYSGGAHGFSEDMKAAGTNLSKVGKRFTINHDYDDELQERKAKLEMLESSAVRNGDDERAIEAFIQYEGLKSDETQLGRGLKGLGTLRSEGKMYYSPLVGEMDYRDDPFIRDVFTTVAMVGAAVSAANAIHTHVTEANKVLDAEQAKAAQVNGTNQQTIDQVHQTGQDIAGHRDTFEKGMEAQANSDAINTLNVGERGASNESVNAGYGWSSGSIYGEADKIAHETAKQAYQTSQQQIQDIAAKYSQGLLSEGEVTQAFADMATQTHQTLDSVVESTLPHFQKYMETHPQFELSEVGKAMDYLVQNPNAIPQMYQGMVDVTNMGESLSGLTIEQVEALQSLPSDLQTTLLGAVSSAALAYNCAKSTSKNRSSAKSEQEAQIIDMVSEYQASQQEQAAEREASHQRAA
jgi:hypothetical protein